MKILELEQRTAPWHEYRSNHIMGTDSAIICGIGPFSTPYELWQRKLGLKQEEEINQHMQRGIDNEPRALEMLIERTKLSFAPAVVESTENPIFGSSLDGLCGTVISELKCGGNKSHEMTKNGDIPIHYLYQIQHQLMVTGAEKCFFANYYDDDLAVIEVYPDLKIHEEIIEKGIKFYECLQNFTPPEMTDKDFVDVTKNMAIREMYRQYILSKDLMEYYKDEMDRNKENIIREAQGKSIQSNGWKMTRIVSEGRINYSQVEKDHPEIIWNEYRKEPQTSYRITTT